jgi:DNA-binding transcriptional ArsR family regulator
MTLPRTVADVLSEHVVFELESVDRMRLNVRQPRLQYGAGVSNFFVRHREWKFASTALMAPMTERYVAEVDHFIDSHQLARERFGNGQRKDEVTQKHLAAHDGSEGVLYVGIAQERATVWTSTRRRNPLTGVTYAWLKKTSKLVNHVYWYCVDDDFGPFLLRVCTYFPFNAQLIVNGNHWAQRQAGRAGIGFTPLDNGFAAVDDVAGVQAICDRFGAAHVEALLIKWQQRLPCPFTEEDENLGGYCYELALDQAEFSLTHMLDKPVSGRIFLEQVIRDNLDLGRPDKVGLIFARQIPRGRKHKTPGPFRTRVLTEGVTASLHFDYKSSRGKQYHKEGRAIRTEITVNNPRDFGLSKRLSALPALRQLGFAAARRLLDVQHISHDPIAGAEVFASITAPIVNDDGSRTPALRFGDLRVHALLQALPLYRFIVHGFTNRDLRTQIAPLLGRTAGDIKPTAISYDLRRLREHGLIHRIPGSCRYQLTDLGYHAALLFTHAHDHLLRTGTAEATDRGADPPPLRRAATAYRQAVTDLAQRAHLPA